MDARSEEHGALMISLPHVIAPDLGIRAIDVLRLPGPARGENHKPLIWFGGDPAKACVVGIKGSGHAHDPVMEVDPTLPAHARFEDWIREILDPQARLQVTPEETTSLSQIALRKGKQ